MLIVVISIIGLAVLLQAIKPEAALKKIVGLLIVAAVVLVLWSALQTMWQGLTIGQRLSVFIFGVLGVVVLIRKIW